MKILLFGAGGLLGRHLAGELTSHGHTVIALTHAQADITDGAQLDEWFSRRPEAVINAAAVCDFDACERDPAGTGRVNLQAPLDLARRCAAQNALFVQFSSDYIFRGDVDRPLTENDEPDPLSVYGSQKAGLEREIPHLCPRSLVIRLSWLYGRDGRTFMSLLPSLLARQETLRIAAGKTGRCLYAPDAAHWIRLLVEGGYTGLFNLANDGDTSWEEFARSCLARMKALGYHPACRHLEEVPYGQVGPDWAKRPHHSSLSLQKLTAALPPGPRRWESALDSYLREAKSVAGASQL
jgi:dTDP-4-dehydrorhamnose reductase